ncbi:MAG: L,D-transpeptidase family protein [Gammaproteobacteria bacterium]|jgi:L,D-transpeptidase ErfK/SrfK
MNILFKINILMSVFLVSVTGAVNSETFDLTNDNSVVGSISFTYSTLEQTLPDIARVHDLGYYEIKRANPDVDTWLPGDNQKIVLPNQFVLPVVPHEGIVVNIPEMRLYYFPKPQKGKAQQVITYPIGIGREGWATPYVSTKIIQKKINPAWYPPDSVREHYAEEGTILPKIVEAGPDNPLGAFAMRLGLPAYLIHGTNKPYGVGMRVSSGCIRLYPEDIESLFGLVTLNTKVTIVNQPYKIGIQGDSIYLEANPFLDEDVEKFDGNLTSVVKMLVNLPEHMDYDVNWDLAKIIIDERKGIPIEIGKILLAENQDTLNDKQSAAMTNNIELKLETGIQIQ